MWNWNDGRKLYPALIYGLIAIIGLMVLWSRTDPVFVALGFGLTGLGSLLSLAVLWNWMAYHWQYRQDQSKRAAVATPFSEAIHAASKLTAEQAAIVPRLMYQVEVSVVMGAQLEIGFVLSTPHGGIPFAWIDQFLATSGVTNLRAIGSYNDKTPGRKFAVMFTEWLVTHGYAIPHNTGHRRASGPNPAAWLTENSRDQVRKILHVDQLLMYSNYANEVPPSANEQAQEGSENATRISTRSTPETQV